MKELASALIVIPERAPRNWDAIVSGIAREFFVRSEQLEVRDQWRKYAVDAEAKYAHA